MQRRALHGYAQSPVTARPAQREVHPRHPARGVSLPVTLVTLFLWWGTYQLATTSAITLRQRLTPDRLQGRVNVTARMIAWGGQPVGAAVGGGLAEVLDLRVALLVAGVGSATSVLYGWLSPLRTAQAAAAGPEVSSRAAPDSG